MKPHKSVYFLLALMIIVWGLSWPISKLGLEYMDSITFVVDRLFIGTLFMFVIVGLIGKLHWPRRNEFLIIFLMGIFQIAWFILFANLGLKYVAAGRSAILVYTTPIWVTPISIFFFHERAGLLKWLGLLLGVIGTIILFGPWSIDWHDTTALYGNTMLLLSAFGWAAAILIARNIHWPRSPLELVPWQLLVGFCPLFLMGWQQHALLPSVWNISIIFSLLYTGIFATAFAYWATMVISKELPAITTSLVYLAVPVFGVLSSAVILHESLDWLTLLAMSVIISGLVCVVLDGVHTRRKKMREVLDNV